MNSQKMLVSKEIDAYREVVRLLAANLIKEMKESSMRPKSFLEQKKVELIGKVLNIDYPYLRTLEGRNTEYVKFRYSEKFPELMDLLDSVKLLEVEKDARKKVKISFRPERLSEGKTQKPETT